MDRVINFIGNEYVAPAGGTYLDNFNPSTGKKICEIADSDHRDVDAAAVVAQHAFKTWSVLSDAERAQYLYAIADAVEGRKREFAETESLDQGKTERLAEDMDIFRVIQNFRFFAGAILHRSQMATQMGQDTLNYVLHKPIGVAGLISPWNLPLYLLSWKIAPAIAVGNTVVCKPSEWTSLTAELFCEVIEGVLPPGVVNMIFGTGVKAGEALVKHPQVPLISFTGGTETGKRIMRESAENIKKLSLELGGKNASLIFADCDFEQAVQQSVRSSFLNQGEICLCSSRIYVEKKIYDQFVQSFKEKAKKLKVGDPHSPDTFMGPLVSKTHYDKVLGCIELAKKEGGTILCGGDRPTDLPDKNKDGYFLNPTVITGLPENSKCIQDEIFGPVVSIAPFSSYEDAIEKANGVRYGLSAAVFTENLSVAHKAARDLKVGTVWINSWLVRDLRVPFGGMKASGIGREGGEHSLEFFSESTTVSLRYK